MLRLYLSSTANFRDIKFSFKFEYFVGLPLDRCYITNKNLSIETFNYYHYNLYSVCMYAHGLFQLKNTPVKSFMKLQIFSKKLAPIGIGDPFLESKGK